MKQHPIVGERICAPLRSFRNVLPILLWHYEKKDGTGYPDHLKGDEIPLAARILQAVDIYDSLTTDRPYRQALAQKKGLEIMWEETRRGAGGLRICCRPWKACWRNLRWPYP
jgi:putative two-component system response regulator